MTVTGLDFPRPPTFPNCSSFRMVPATFLIPQGNGIRSFLLFSCVLGPGVTQQLREDALRDTEPGEWVVHWGDELIAHINFQERKLRSVIGQRPLKSLLEPYEQDEPNWMRGRIVPKRLPAAVRPIDPLHFLLWASL